MSMFLNLPVELRELILADVLYSPFTPPETQPDLEAGVQYHDMDYMAWVWQGPKTYYVPQRRESSSLNCLSLFLACHQISAETRALLARCRRPDYRLDVSVQDERDILLTWLCVPCLTPNIATLYVDRIARSYRGDGGQLGVHWAFYAALERFLRYGPMGHQQGSSEGKCRGFADRGMRVETLVLDFQSADSELEFPPSDTVSYAFWLRWHSGITLRRLDDPAVSFSRFKTRPEWFCEHLQGWIGTLLAMNYHTARYGQLLYDHIGTIKMLVNGQLYKEFDLAALLHA
ncbi:uncharacterized protein BO97DRAFT_469889 [Aspergillus homomorphus CBS 101889]|uniref:Uncharacterized protein n=1 Tax=Aspergillus homomorphus (strain CBS 101889) TaxID=1450537 RepID=A0A395I0J9_ASPHC|nr:hypothetical protein BO97DRAFT_469889 [Aspergillus homomorphus CBS 101889]RAL13153.1 hypothetical protein BO97DRAFT_469889 [Aspergillus homomorphus CBS 101889]